MGRPKLDPKVKKARLEAARKEAAAINKSRHRPVFCYAYAEESGRVRMRYEPPGGKKVTLRSPFPSLEFEAELLAIKQGQPVPAAPAVPTPVEPPRETHTWRWLCEQFFDSRAFRKYGQRDQRVRRQVLEKTWDEPLDPAKPTLKFGDMPAGKFQTKAIITLRDRRAGTTIVSDAMYPNDRTKDREVPAKPEAGASVVRYIRLVTAWAREHHTDLVGGRSWGHEVKLYADEVAASTGHKTWGPEQCEAFEKRHEPGTKARLMYDLARRSVQRLSDVTRLGPGMLGFSAKGVGRLKFVQDKNHNRSDKAVTAFVPMTPELKAAVAAAEQAGITGKTTWLARNNGEPYEPESVGNDFRDYCREAGLEGYSMHGLRKTGVVDLIQADCTFHQIMSITGHRTKKEIERYGREFMREVAMEGAFEKWLEKHRHEEEFTERMLDAA